MKKRQNFYWWWKMTGKYLHKDIYYGIRNLIRYFTTVWKDRSYGCHWTLELLKVKLKYVIKDVTKANYAVGWERDMERAQLTINLINKIQEDYYELENMGEDFKPKDYSEYFKKYPLIYKYIVNNPNDSRVFSTGGDSGIAISIGLINTERAKTLLFKIINENIYSWGW